MNLFERAVRVMKSYANALVTSAEARTPRHNRRCAPSLASRADVARCYAYVSIRAP
jgi:hypothetical protein